ncbi:MAG: flagellar hook-length control protein FliK [Pseudomonadota bacterium]
MNAGLLGEHLASPRTAQKTNQSTALDPKTAKGGDSANKDGFASFVSKDSQSAAADAPPPENAVAQTNALPPAPDKILAQPLDAAGIGAPDFAEDSALPQPVPTALDAVESDPQVRLNANGQTADSEALNVPAALTGRAQTGEVLAQDPSARSIAEPRESARAAHGETIKITDPAIAIAGDSTPEGDVTIDPQIDLEQRTRTPSGSVETDADLPRPQGQLATADAEARQAIATDTASTDRLINAGVARDALTPTAEPVLTTAPIASASSSANTVNLGGLTPTAPSIPLATPNELTGIIVNAINNGLDPQEQLVVQMDPPELGRVLIDFKFDAQGLQQVIVTTDNPEALKRLRELHFELTQALKEHGLSEQNMSFRQEAEGQSQEAWGSDAPLRQDTQIFAAEERRTSPSATPTGPRSVVQERLDLLL